MDKSQALMSLAFMGAIIILAGAFVLWELKMKKIGRLAMLIGFLHFIPIFFYVWIRAIL